MPGNVTLVSLSLKENRQKCGFTTIEDDDETIKRFHRTRSQSRNKLGENVMGSIYNLLLLYKD